jgi:ADP-ribose pyrophosphatase YjhB (NUDIX family)
MAHIHEKIDFCADALIVNGDRVLLRMHDKYGYWSAPGGHVDLDEDPPTAAVREAKEEVGLDITLIGTIAPSVTPGERELLVPRFINRHFTNPTHEHITFMYFATSPTRDFKQGATEVSDDIRWFTREELDDPKYGIRERIKMYAKAALDELSTKK